MPGRRSLTFFEALVVLSAIGGIIAAGNHVYILANPMVSCGIDTLQPIVDDLPLAKLWPLAFQVDGFCSTPYPPLLGLSLAQWALVAFVLTAILVPLGIYRNRRQA
ncbi:disulfide bond formation protein B [compost metagenome]